MEQSLAKSEGHRVRGGSIPGQLVQRPRKKMEQVPSGNEEMPREWKAGDETTQELGQLIHGLWSYCRFILKKFLRSI